MVNLPSEFDVFSCSLNGVNQIEASAGTGKTWNLCALYLRLLLEKGLNVDQILLVTFSKAATAELQQRIRSCIAQLLHALAVGNANDPLVTQMLKKLSTNCIEQTQVTRRLPVYEEAQRRLKRAWRCFDQAAIYTIHAFCQQALMDTSFTALRPFKVDLVAQDDALRIEIAVEFWQTSIEPVTEPGFTAWLAKQGVGPAVLAQQLAQRLKKPLAQLVFGATPRATEVKDDGEAMPPLNLDPHCAADSLINLFAEARKLWYRDRALIAQTIQRSLDQLNSTSYKPTAMTRAFDAWTSYFDGADAHAVLGDKAHLLTASVLTKRGKKNGAVPEHRFFHLAEALVAQIVALDEAYSARWLTVVQAWLNWAPGRLREKKRAQRMTTFDDLLANLHQALVDQPQLTQALKQRYPAALIDEFQDTDPLQFDIFRRIFVPQGPLFLVGDPKQAIYSFRSADLHTYLNARKYASARYTLTTNQRSTALLITACNRIFSINPAAFILHGLDYQAVHASATRASKRLSSDCHERAARCTAVNLPGALHIWMLPHGAHVLAKRDAMHAAAHASAAQIARWLHTPSTCPLSSNARASAGAGEGEHEGKQPLAPSDIAVLVQTHKQGKLMKCVLAEWGLASIETTQGSVFSTQEAEYLERVLRAIDTPHNTGCLRGALTVDWLGLNAQNLVENRRIEAFQAHFSLSSWVERFTHYRTLWHQRGFAVMWPTLMRELRIAQRIAAGSNGERRLTDLIHLTELISARAAQQPGIAPTLHWLGIQRARQRGDDQAQLRLESDQNLVQIVTVHKSKGLEYPIVFCPFLFAEAQHTVALNSLANACEYHTHDGSALLHYSDDTSVLTHAKQVVKREQAAERVRLIYVALTRAIYHCFIVAGLYTSGPSASTKLARQNGLNWLVTDTDATGGHDFSTWLAKPPQDDEIISNWYALANEAITVEPLPSILPDRSLSPISTFNSSVSAVGPLHARCARRALHETWQIMSFSSLIKAEGDEAQAIYPIDNIDAINAMNHAMNTQPDPEDEDAIISRVPSTCHDMSTAHDILHFPRGTIAGHCLHRLFELTDFTLPNTWPATIERALREHPVSAPSVLTKQMPSMMASLLHAVAHTELTPLAPGVTLASVDPAHRLTELEFTFPATVDLTALRSLFQAYGYPYPDRVINADTLTGYMKGFIDLVFEYDKRFWIVDWKSNHLGYTAADYQYDALHQAMTQHSYHLQALIYTIALHRYLRLRLPGYDYATHFGGCLYLFVRGVRPEWQIEGRTTGVYADRPEPLLIDRLDRLMRNNYPTVVSGGKDGASRKGSSSKRQ